MFCTMAFNRVQFALITNNYGAEFSNKKLSINTK